MKKIILSIVLCIPVFASCQIALQAKDTISSEINTIKSHSYKIRMEENQVALLKVNQIGIDLAITTFDTNGEKIAEFDSPNGRYGPELITLTSNKSGWHTIEIKSIDGKNQEGNYQLYIQKTVARATTLFEQVDQLFLPWNSADTPGAAITILQKGEVIYQNTYGMANLEYGIPITSTSVFRTGSVAKQFTAFSLLLLEKQGKLSLEDDIRTYIPEVPDYGTPITLRHLANHTSGIREESVLAALMGWDEGDIVTKEQVLKVIAKQQGLNFIPGEQYMYCNTGYTLLAEVVSRVSGQSFSTFTNTHIFTPLGMKNTQFLDDPKSIISNKVYSYYDKGNTYVKALLNDANTGGSGLLTTIEDLTLWVQNFEQKSIGTTEIFSTMKSLGTLNNGTRTNYGMGMETSLYKGLKDVGHGGAFGGFRARIATFSEHDFAVILLANTPAIHPLHIPNLVVDIFLKDVQVQEEEHKNQTSNAIPTSVKEGFDSNDIPSYLGTYYSKELGVEYDFILIEEKLVLQHPRLQINLIPSSKDECIVDGWAVAIIRFNRNNDKNINGFTFSMVNTKNIQFIKR